MAHVKLNHAIALLIILTSVSVARATQQPNSCITRDESMAIRHAFFSKLPDADTFAAYAGDGRLRIFTNVAEGAALEADKASTDKKILWLSSIMKTHARLFSIIPKVKTVHFAYMKGRLRNAQASVESLQSSARFPRNECVEEVIYEFPRGECVMAQRINRLSFDFTKDDGVLRFAGIEMYLESCSE
ncbi:conserved exported protein of unknown function [Caballeronia sp. S22]